MQHTARWFQRSRRDGCQDGATLAVRVVSGISRVGICKREINANYLWKSVSCLTVKTHFVCFRKILWPNALRETISIEY
jgi:hypothetical protein